MTPNPIKISVVIFFLCIGTESFLGCPKSGQNGVKKSRGEVMCRGPGEAVTGWLNPGFRCISKVRNLTGPINKVRYCIDRGLEYALYCREKKDVNDSRSILMRSGGSIIVKGVT